MVVGAGYIAVEMAGILKALGSDVTQIIRKDKVLRTFDSMVCDAVTAEVEHMGVKLLRNSNVDRVEKKDDGLLTVHTKEGETVEGVDCLLWAIGRSPNTEKLGLDKTSELTNE